MSRDNPPTAAAAAAATSTTVAVGAGSTRRRSSITQAAFSNLFQRNVNSPPFSGSVNGSMNDAQRRRLSITTIGLSAAPPSNPPAFGLRRGSTSASSDSLDESAIEDDDGLAGAARTIPATPFSRRLSMGASAMRGYRPGGSPGNDQHGFNWSEQLRSRAESSVSGARPSISPASSPPRDWPHHDRAKSVSDMSRPSAQVEPAVGPKTGGRKPDAFQERILKGDFYMD